MTQRKRWLVASAVAGIAVYAMLWIGYVSQWEWLAAFDSWGLDTAYGYGIAHPGWVTGWEVFCTVLGPGAFRLAAIVAIVVALVRRRIRVAIFLLLTVELSGLLTEFAKALADRPRPITALVFAPGTSFPSGHALGIMTCVLAVLTLVLPVMGPPARRWLIGLGVLLVIAIGVGRVILNVHHPSDVLAGWALGYAYFVACYLIVPPTRPNTAAAGTPAIPDSAH